MPTAPRTAPRRRGRVATHGTDALLDLVAAGAREAVAQGKTMTPARVSMPVFDVVKRDVDRARGITDPDGSAERTPTADAIQKRFTKLAERPVAWGELVDGALRPGRDRVMWLAALRRDEPHGDVTDARVIHALRLVATCRQVASLTRAEYDDTRDELVREDVRRYGDEALLPRLLPTSNQVLVHCDHSWSDALELASLRPYRQDALARHRRPPPRPLGMPLAQVVAVYGALNGVWPSTPIVAQFARSCGIAVADKVPGGMGPVRAEAARLLSAEGITPPTRTRGGGKSRRLSFRYPVNGIPGAPLRDPGAHADPRLAELRREFCVISLRVWLAGLHADARTARTEYVAWQVGTGWQTVTMFDKYDHGGFSALKQEATDENVRVRQAGGDPLVEALALAETLRAETEAIKTSGAGQPEPVPFGAALRAVLADTHAEVQTPKMLRE